MGSWGHAGQPYLGIRHVLTERAHLAHAGTTFPWPGVVRNLQKPDPEELSHRKCGGPRTDVETTDVGGGNATPGRLSSQLSGALTRAELHLCGHLSVLVHKTFSNLMENMGCTSIASYQVKIHLIIKCIHNTCSTIILKRSCVLPSAEFSGREAGRWEY